MGSLRLPAALGRGQMGWGPSGGMGGCPYTRAHARNAKINMLENCKWPPPWRQPCLSCLTCIHVRACVCVHVRTCMGGAPTQPHPHPPTHPPTQPPGGAPQISKNVIRLERIKIFRFRLKIWNLWRIPHPWVGVFFWWVGGWMGGLVGRKM